jgi:hypothetical protein
MLLIVVAQKKKFSIKSCKFHSSKSVGFLKLLLNKGVVVQEELALDIVTDCILLHFFPKWINIVILK